MTLTISLWRKRALRRLSYGLLFLPSDRFVFFTTPRERTRGLLSESVVAKNTARRSISFGEIGPVPARLTVFFFVPEYAVARDNKIAGNCTGRSPPPAVRTSDAVCCVIIIIRRFLLSGPHARATVPLS